MWVVLKEIYLVTRVGWLIQKARTSDIGVQAHVCEPVDRFQIDPGRICRY
jgi:hypothetical protein